MLLFNACFPDGFDKLYQPKVSPFQEFHSRLELLYSGLVQYDSSQETASVFAVALLCRTVVNKNNSRQVFKKSFDDDSLDEENIGYLNPKPRFRCYVKIKLLYIQL